MTAEMQAEFSARVALEAAGLGAWDIVPATETTSLSRGARLLLGLSPDGEVDCEELVGALCPADRARCVAALLGAIGSSEESRFRIDVSLARRQARWLRLAGAACVDAAGHVHLVGTIEDVELAESAQAAVLTVANRGRPIPATTHEQLLDPLRNERWRRDGHGLGLHIVHEIVREHGGSIEVVSDDSRTVINVELPKGDPGMAAASDPQRRAAG